MGTAKKIATIGISFFALVGIMFTLVWVGMNFGLFNVRGSIHERNSFFTSAASVAAASLPCTQASCEWLTSAEWATVRAGLAKDAPVIARVASETGVPARMIAAAVIPEQMRFFTSEREVYKSVFEPLKILGPMSEFSLGVSGIKMETAREIERRLGTTTPETDLYARLTDPHDHYYSYLYTALFIKLVSADWAAAGYPISNRPAIIATLFNIGFANSHPNPTPQSGGSTITVDGINYLFGDLAQSFYDSGELTEFVK